MTSLLNRRKFASLAAATSAAAVSAPYVWAQSKGAITYFSSAAYTDSRLFTTFAKDTGLDLKVQNFGDTDAMVARLTATKGAGLDICMCPNNLTAQLYRDGYFQKIDVRRLKSWQKLFPELRNANFLETDEKDMKIGVPLAWGPEGLIYRTDKIQHADSWNDMWDPRWKGRVAAPNYGYEMVLMAAQVLGYKAELAKEPITFSDQQYAAIKQKLIDQKKLITKYWGSAAEGASLIVGGEAWISVGRIAMLGPARDEKVQVKLIAPKEGAQGWCASMCFVKSSTNTEAVYAFLEWMISEYQIGLSKIKSYPSVNKPFMMELPEGLRNDLTLGDPNLLTSMVWWKQASDVQRINNLWNEVKAS